MPEEWRSRLRALARRAGLERVPESVVLAAIALCGVLIAWGAWAWWPRQSSADMLAAGRSARPQSVAASSGPASNEGTAGQAGTPTSQVWVHVVGAVRRPGVYQLPAGARLVAALDAAGGLLGNAAPQAVNLARQVEDGEQIVVPTKDEFEKGGASSSGSGVPGSVGVAGGQTGASAPGPVDINSADAALLDTLPGIGPSTAAKIVADREANGPFASVEDLGRVTGIGPKKLDALKDLVRVR